MGWDGMITTGRWTFSGVNEWESPVPADAGKESLRRGWWGLLTGDPGGNGMRHKESNLCPPRNGKGARCRFFNRAAVMMIRL